MLFSHAASLMQKKKRQEKPRKIERMYTRDRLITLDAPSLIFNEGHRSQVR